MSLEPVAEKQQESQYSATEKTATQEALPQELLEQLTAWFKHSLAAGGELAELFRLELQLTLGDARRILLILLALLPILLLTWISLGVLASWLVYDISGSVMSALVTFTLLQLVVTVCLVGMTVFYSRQMGFRRTKEHAKRLMQGVQGEPPNTD